MRNAYVSVVNPKQKNLPRERPSRRRENNIKKDFKETGYGDVNWTHLAQDRDHWLILEDTAMDHRLL
jgi:hypothetical protein